MEIIGKIKIKGFLSVDDLDGGDVFTFLDDSEPYMLCSNSYIVNLATGDMIGEACDLLDRPIRRIKATLLVED